MSLRGQTVFLDREIRGEDGGGVRCLCEAKQLSVSTDTSGGPGSVRLRKAPDSSTPGICDDLTLEWSSSSDAARPSAMGGLRFL